MPSRRSTTLLEDAIDIPVWLEDDARRPLAERARRDRGIGLELHARDAAARVRAWWRSIDGARRDTASARLERARRWAGVVLAAIGLVSGAVLALAAYRYDGTYPINVVRVLGLLLVPQLLALTLSLLLVPARMPGLRLVQDALAAINPGAIAAAVYGHFADPARARLLGATAARNPSARRFGKWQMLYWSQVAAVGFNLGIVVAATALIAFTDLAFGWSTTLDIGAERAARAFEALAAPWQGLAPAAVPEAGLVERSRFYRLEGGDAFADSRALTQWWSFTLLAVVVYGLVPRFGFMLLAGWRLRRATRALLLDDPRVAALLDRMSAPTVESRGNAAGGASNAAPATPPRVARVSLPARANAVIWSSSIAPAAAADFVRARFGTELETVVEAGDGRLDADRTALARIARPADAVLVLAPAWEPPLLEFADFLGALREAIGSGTSIVVVPVGEAAEPVSAVERDTWARAVQRAGDPAAYVEAGDA